MDSKSLIILGYIILKKSPIILPLIIYEGELTGDLLNEPIFGFGEQKRAQFIDPKSLESPRLDKYFFQNRVIYNEQPSEALLCTRPNLYIQ